MLFIFLLTGLAGGGGEGAAVQSERDEGGFACWVWGGGELRRADIELRRGFGERWALNMEEEALREIKRICKERLVREAELDYERELRFEEDVRSF
jgi:hypothetical protein